jgi:hypothetical protein
MSKFATMLALMLATGYAAYCLVTYPNTDVHFTYAAYTSGAIAAILVFTELARLIFRGIFDCMEWMRTRRHARQDLKAGRTTTLNEPVRTTVVAPSADNPTV